MVEGPGRLSAGIPRGTDPMSTDGQVPSIATRLQLIATAAKFAEHSLAAGRQDLAATILALLREDLDNVYDMLGVSCDHAGVDGNRCSGCGAPVVFLPAGLTLPAGVTAGMVADRRVVLAQDLDLPGVLTESAPTDPESCSNCGHRRELHSSTFGGCFAPDEECGCERVYRVTA